MASPQSPAVLVVNTGSSSVKLALCTPSGARLWHDQRSWGLPVEDASNQPNRPSPQAPSDLPGLLEQWFAPLLASWDQRPELVVHRLVHGGAQFTAPTQLTPAVIDHLEAITPLAPLHNGPALAAIRWLEAHQPCRSDAPIQQWACFDTAFHASLSETAFSYAIPAAWRSEGLRRYGFHGLNHCHVGETVARQEPAVRRLISCHLGAGCSLCAIAISADGIPLSIDTTMGFTPLEGLVMASRSGSVDPGLLLHLLRQGMGAAELDRALNRQSGLLGLSGLSGDMRELRQAASAGHRGAELAIGVFRHRLLQGIGAMAASLGGVDAIALTGGIGEHDTALAAELAEGLAWLGPLHWLRVPADEEGLMARQCLAALSASPRE
jgi:acetate kinase